jgi:uncharacterized protein
MNTRIKIIALLAIFAVSALNYSCSKKTELKALIVTGQNNHNWQRSSIVLKHIVEKAGMFSVETVVSPRSGADMSEFIVDFKPYNLVVLDYTGDNWPEETRNNFVSYVQEGGGVVVYHAANNAFPDWPEYNEIIGLGGWGDRNENSGPYIYVEDGKVVRDDRPGRGGSHGSQHEFVVQSFKPEHPILKGLPEKWLQVKDELYSELRGPANNLEVLAYAHADEKFGGTGRNEPILMTITYGKGRIFHTVLGHAGGDLFPPAMQSAGFVVTTQRGAEWAATGKVTQKLPATFPNETTTMQWEFFEDISSDISPVVKRMKNYTIGHSTEPFVIMKKLLADNSNNAEKMKEYQDIVREILQSRKATPECKKMLLKEFSWMMDDSFMKVLDGLKSNPELAGEVKYALDIMGK